MPRWPFRPFQELFSLLFPKTCCHCGAPLVGDEHDLCVRCLLHLPLARHSSQPSNLTEQRLLGRLPIVSATSLLLFKHGTASQSLLHQIKYRNAPQLAHSLGRQMGMDLLQSGRFQQIDLLMPVPLHWRRRWQRGYNQSEMLCLGISEILHCPVSTRHLYRTAHTGTQTRKKRQARMDNMQGVFALRHTSELTGLHVLLVDDVITTGATVEACGKLLLQIDGLRLSIASLAVTVR